LNQWKFSQGPSYHRWYHYQQHYRAHLRHQSPAARGGRQQFRNVCVKFDYITLVLRKGFLSSNCPREGKFCSRLMVNTKSFRMIKLNI
jgi:hypothetical protein